MRHFPHRHPRRQAFTLVELAIVLVVVGLLVGAITMGSSLLKQSELQTVISDYTKYSNAVDQVGRHIAG